MLKPRPKPDIKTIEALPPGRMVCPECKSLHGVESVGTRTVWDGEKTLIICPQCGLSLGHRRSDGSTEEYYED